MRSYSFVVSGPPEGMAEAGAIGHEEKAIPKGPALPKQLQTGCFGFSIFSHGTT